MNVRILRTPEFPQAGNRGVERLCELLTCCSREAQCRRSRAAFGEGQRFRQLPQSRAATKKLVPKHGNLRQKRLPVRRAPCEKFTRPVLGADGTGGHRAGIFLDHRMKIGASESKGAYGRPSRMRGIFDPGRGLLEHVNRA